LSKLARGDGVAKEIFKHSALHHSSQEIIAGLNPSFAEWMMGYETGWSVLSAAEMPSSRKSQKSSGGQ
jgi:hypothetical protein